MDSSPNLLMTVMTIDGWITESVDDDSGDRWIAAVAIRYIQPRIYSYTRIPAMACHLLNSSHRMEFTNSIVSWLLGDIPNFFRLPPLIKVKAGCQNNKDLEM